MSCFATVTHPIICPSSHLGLHTFGFLLEVTPRRQGGGSVGGKRREG